MPGNYLPKFVRQFRREKRRWVGALLFSGVIILIYLPSVFAEEANSAAAAPKFLGAQSCSSSSCHGGAGEKNNQYTIWSTHDFHHARPYATLETARSERLAEVLKIGNPVQSARCTVCHAPFQTVPAERLGHDAKITEGVSCESCHGPAENWIRSHTRLDYTHADRVAAGMRDLKNLYVRANTCVACHQNLDPEIRAAGHPELIFEMDGQSVTMPRHWREDKPGFDIWWTGQFVALREMGWQLSNEKSPSSDLVERWDALVWLMHMGRPATTNVYSLSPDDLNRSRLTADKWARRGAEVRQTAAEERAMKTTTDELGMLSETTNSFTDNSVLLSIRARRAERLVLALDRIVISVDLTGTNSAVNESLNKLFADAQSLPDFDPDQFAKDLNIFHTSVAGFLPTQ